MKVRPMQRFPTRKHPSVRGPVNHQAPSFASYQHYHAEHSTASSNDSSEEDAEEIYDMTNLSLGDIEDIKNTIRILHNKADMDALGWMSPLKKYYKSPRGKGPPPPSAADESSAFPFTDEHIGTPKKQKSPRKSTSKAAGSSSDEALFTPNASLPIYRTNSNSDQQSSDDQNKNNRRIQKTVNMSSQLPIHPPKPSMGQHVSAENQVDEMWNQFEAMFVEDELDLNKIRNNSQLQGGSKKQVHFSGQENQESLADDFVGTKAHLKQFLSSPVAHSSEASFLVNSLPPLILDKLKQAEKQLELELTKDRQRALSKLQQILLIGKQAYMAEVDHELLQQWEQRDRSLVLHQLHDEVMAEAMTAFGLHRGQASTGSTLKLDSDQGMYIQLLVKQVKAKKQTELNDELRILTSQLAKVTAKQVEETSKLNISHSVALTTVEDDKSIRAVIDEFQSLVQQMSSKHMMASYPKQWSLQEVVEKYREQQVRIHEELTKEYTRLKQSALTVAHR